MPDLREPSDALAAQDSAARTAALDVARSFLVQAPAGSGKTELLIQRFLALLAGVERAESIVAMTFTRKAAAEMRERIVDALRRAADDGPVDSEHQMVTRRLARAALEQDRRQQWRLIEHPARLQVQTFDALCMSIARQAPLTTGVGAEPRVEERASPLYRQAARDALAASAADDPSWRTLLDYFDNDADRVVQLLADMLGRRDLWLGEVIVANPATLRAELEAVLDAEISGELAALRAGFPGVLARRLVLLQVYAATNLAALDPARAASLAACAAAGGLPPAASSALDDWRALAHWLLAAKGPTFARQLNTSKGFPAKATGPGSGERAGRKHEIESVLADLTLAPGLGDALDAARRLPPPRYVEASWAIVAALLTVLPGVAAHLVLVFRSQATIDFTQTTRLAIAALGEAESPSELLLKLDVRITHLLVDEFQDTSYSQQELLRRLTAGWQRGDGRTLFCVGDPMQSIYKFREAEVRLFVEAQQRGMIADIPVESLILRRNFRSRPALVAWSNAVFANVLGPRSDPWRGLVAFAPATPARAIAPDTTPTIDVAPDVAGEAAHVVARVDAALRSGVGDIAVLVRARAHLDSVLPALRSAGIAYTAVELDLLAERQVILDLTSLTHALIQPADRLAWLSVLRAPWCGLLLADLFALCAAADAAGGISLAPVIASFVPAGVASGVASGVGDGLQAPDLSPEGRQRLARIAPVLATTIANRGRATLSSRVRGAWLALGGPACVDDPMDLAAAERYFALLDQHQRGADIADWSALLQALDATYVDPEVDSTAASEPSAGGRRRPISVMTLHRAKGLEFDTVIIPGLARKPPTGHEELLRWRRRPQGMMLGPVRAVGGEPDGVSSYLAQLKQREDAAELGRLLYVGCTRARERLHLIAAPGVFEDKHGNIAWRSPAAHSLWRILDDALPPAATPLPTMPDGRSVAGSPSGARLSRVPSPWAPQVPVDALPPPRGKQSRDADTPAFDWARETAKHVGTVAHQFLAGVAVEGIGHWTGARVKLLHGSIAAQLLLEGVAADDLPPAVALVQGALDTVLTDGRGRWLFDPRHEQARSEFALTVEQEPAPLRVVLDRTFVDAAGVRWIVDFKLSRHEGADVEAFLDNERERYRAQLETYARVIRAVDPRERPIRLGLYFPLLRGWREWTGPS